MAQWNAFADMETLRREVDRAFEEFAATQSPASRAAFLPGRGPRRYPLINLLEDKENLYIEALTPGVEPRSLSVSVMRNRLSHFNLVSLTLGFAFLYLPIVLLVVYSFNDSRLVAVWGGFSTRWYAEVWQNAALLDAAWVTLRVAFVSATSRAVSARYMRVSQPESLMNW